MKEYSTFPKFPEKEPHHQILFTIMPKTLLADPTPLWKKLAAYSEPRPQVSDIKFSYQLTINRYSNNRKPVGFLL